MSIAGMNPAVAAIYLKSNGRVIGLTLPYRVCCSDRNGEYIVPAKRHILYGR
jgi:hypothetical protein